jgi:hypothetical protein
LDVGSSPGKVVLVIGHLADLTIAVDVIGAVDGVCAVVVVRSCAAGVIEEGRRVRNVTVASVVFGRLLLDLSG